MRNRHRLTSGAERFRGTSNSHRQWRGHEAARPAHQCAERVEDGLCPGRHLLALAAGQVAQILAAHRVERPEHDHLAVLLALQHRLQACAQRERRLARCRPAHPATRCRPRGRAAGPARSAARPSGRAARTPPGRRGPAGRACPPSPGPAPPNRRRAAEARCWPAGPGPRRGRSRRRGTGASTSALATSRSAMPVQPEGTTSSAWYSSAASPTAAAFTRSGMSLVTSTTSPSPAARRSAARFSAQARMRLSLASLRKPAGSTSGSVWLSSTCRVAPPDPIGTGASRRPCRMRSSSSWRSAVRANHPSSGWWRLPSSSEMTTSGRTTSWPSNRVSDHGSDSRTEVSST